MPDSQSQNHTSTVHFRLDSEIKARMEEICERLGLTLSQAFSIFAHAFVRENGIPFEVRLPNDYSFCSENHLGSEKEC